MGAHEHEQRAEAETPPIRCTVITISDTRTEATDTSGAAICAALEAAGHTVAQRSIVPDDPTRIAALVRAAAASSHAVITNGGTGIAARDSTFEAIDGLLEKRLPGFGELFRVLSYEDIGAAAMLSRATAGIVGEAIVFCLPGSSGAVRLAMDKLIVPQLPHLVWELLRQKP